MLNIIAVVGGIALIVGAVKRIACLLVNWMCSEVVGIILSTIGIVLISVNSLQDPNNRKNLTAVFVTLAAVATAIRISMRLKMQSFGLFLNAVG